MTTEPQNDAHEPDNKGDNQDGGIIGRNQQAAEPEKKPMPLGLRMLPVWCCCSVLLLIYFVFPCGEYRIFGEGVYGAKLWRLYEGPPILLTIIVFIVTRLAFLRRKSWGRFLLVAFFVAVSSFEIVQYHATWEKFDGLFINRSANVIRLIEYSAICTGLLIWYLFFKKTVKDYFGGLMKTYRQTRHPPPLVPSVLLLITAVSLLFGCLLLLSSLPLLLCGHFHFRDETGHVAFGKISHEYAPLLAGCILIVSGIAFLKRKSWGRFLHVGFLGLLFLGFGGALLYHPQAGDFAICIPWLLFGGYIGILIRYLFFTRTVQDYFGNCANQPENLEPSDSKTRMAELFRANRKISSASETMTRLVLMIIIIIVSAIVMVFAASVIFKGSHVFIAQEANGSIRYTVDNGVLFFKGGKTFTNSQACAEYVWNHCHVNNTVRFTSTGQIGTNDALSLMVLIGTRHIYLTTWEITDGSSKGVYQYSSTIENFEKTSELPGTNRKE